MLAMVAIALPASAQGVRANVKANIEARRASTTERIQEMRANMMMRKASSTERRVEMQQGLAKRKAENVARVIKATIERLEKIILRIESRIAKVEAQGGDTSESKAFVAAAKVNLADAKLAVDAFASLDLTSDKASENFEKVRVAAAEAKEYIRSAHQNLMMAVRSLKVN